MMKCVLTSLWTSLSRFLQPLSPSSRVHQIQNRVAPSLGCTPLRRSGLWKSRGIVARWRSWGPGQVSSWILRHATQGKDFGRPDSAQSGTRRRVTPRKRLLKLLHEPRSRVNNHSPPCPVCNYVHRIMLQFYVSFCIFIPHVVSYFLPISHLVRVVQSYRRWACLRYLWLIWGHLIIIFARDRCCWIATPQKANANGGEGVGSVQSA
jgi:hypothetical protein